MGQKIFRGPKSLGLLIYISQMLSRMFVQINTVLGIDVVTLNSNFQGYESRFPYHHLELLGHFFPASSFYGNLDQVCKISCYSLFRADKRNMIMLHKIAYSHTYLIHLWYEWSSKCVSIVTKCSLWLCNSGDCLKIYLV